MTELDCDEFVEEVTAFMDGALDAEEEARFVEHLAICSGCERYLDQIRLTVRQLGELPPEGLDSDARRAILAAFRDLPE